MISEQELLQVRLLSDYTLYPDAVAFVNDLKKPLPANQANGLLNASLADSYTQLGKFLQGQYNRKTWPEDEQYIPQFYVHLEVRLQDIQREYLPIVTQSRHQELSTEDHEQITMLLAREFIQHIVAENAYMEHTRSSERAKTDSTNNQDTPHNERRPTFNNRREQQR